jgi:hypothetical protein
MSPSPPAVPCQPRTAVIHGARNCESRNPTFALSSAAAQLVYQRGVPHTDRQGSIRFRYDTASFFPRCLYHAMAGSFHAIKGAGFNCVHTWEGYGIDDVIGELRSANLQLIKHWPTDAEVSGYAADPNILAWYLDEESAAQIYLDAQRSGDSTLMGRRYQEFLSRFSAIKALDTRHPVFSLGTAWIPPDSREWWERWSTVGDITAHDDYPLLSTTTDFESLANSVQLAHYSGESHTQSPIRAMLKARGSRYTLLAANLERQAFGVGFEFVSDIASVRRAEPGRFQDGAPP